MGMGTGTAYGYVTGETGCWGWGLVVGIQLGLPRGDSSCDEEGEGGVVGVGRYAAVMLARALRGAWLVVGNEGDGDLQISNDRT